MESYSVTGVVLAAGLGTRMKSKLPKGLHKVCGVPMVEIIARGLKKAGVERPIIVVGYGAEEIERALGDGYDYVIQDRQLGTGHAAMAAKELLRGRKGSVIVAFGDTPLVDESAFLRLLEDQRKQGAACSFSATIHENPTGYGRVIRDAAGNVVADVEEKDCTPEQRAIKECHVGVHCFDIEALLEAFPKLTPANAQGEYYLTDTIAILANSGKKVVATLFEDPTMWLGVNDRWALAEAERLLRQRINKRLAYEGVTFVDPAASYVGLDVRIGRDTIIHPGTHLEGQTTIGEGCEIGPYARIRDSLIAGNTRILMSHVEMAEIGSDVWIGPYSNIRPGARIFDGCKIGDFVEIKNSVLKEGVKASHLTYLGDAEIGAETNIGAGTITCNYDGFEKHRTTIGTDCFIGSSSTLVAPVTIGDNAMTAAGSVITRDVASDSLALGRARQENKEAWVSEWRRRKTTRRG